MPENPEQPVKPGRLGILAGTGELPWLGARRALAAGEDVRIFYFSSEKPPSDLASISTPVVLIKIFTSVIRSMKRQNVRRLMLLGKATRDELYGNSPLAFDWRILFILARSRNQNDYTVFDVVSRQFVKRGIVIIPQDTYFDDFYLPPGRYGKKCNGRELNDIVYGMGYAREINRLDIGQTVVVGNRSVLAVECAEGTDRCIRRGGELFHRRGAVVCKTAKKNQDYRFDIPVTGESTLESMSAGGCRILAIESRKTFVINPAGFLTKAKKMGITVFVLDREKIDLSYLKRLNTLDHSKAIVGKGVRR